MEQWTQHILVGAIVAGCVAFIVWQLAGTLFGRRSRTGNCCARGCSTDDVQRPPKVQRTVFLPAELLRRRK